MSTSKVMWIFFGSFVVGAAAAILLAPDSGKGTRKKLKKTLEQLGEEIVPVLQEIQQELDQVFMREENDDDEVFEKNQVSLAKE